MVRGGGVTVQETAFTHRDNFTWRGESGQLSPTRTTLHWWGGGGGGRGGVTVKGTAFTHRDNFTWKGNSEGDSFHSQGQLHMVR